jgi:hypothetical protein
LAAERGELDLIAADAVKSECKDDSRSSPTRLQSAAAALHHCTHKRTQTQRIAIPDKHSALPSSHLLHSAAAAAATRPSPARWAHGPPDARQTTTNCPFHILGNAMLLAPGASALHLRSKIFNLFLESSSSNGSCCCCSGCCRSFMGECVRQSSALLLQLTASVGHRRLSLRGGSSFSSRQGPALALRLKTETQAES